MALALAGCGVPVDRSPSALPRKDIPFGLLQPSARSTTTSVPSTLESPVQIFLVSPSGHLAAVARSVRTTQESLAAVLGVLVRGPTNVEAALGFQSAIPSQTVVLGATVGSNEIATVNLGGGFGQLVGQAQIEAVAQIVFTAGALPGVAGVTFALAGKAVDVPTASGASVPVATPAQFAALAPVSSGTTSG
jgi:spore germination protein GerM